MDRWRGIATAGLVLAGTSAGWLAGRSSAPSRADEILDELHRLHAQTGPDARCAMEMSPETASALRADLARMFKEQQPCSEKEASARPAPATEPKPEPPAPPSTENVAAHDQAMTLIEQAKSGREWSDADAHAFRGLLPQMTPEQQQAAIRALLVGINTNQIIVRSPRPF